MSELSLYTDSTSTSLIKSYEKNTKKDNFGRALAHKSKYIHSYYTLCEVSNRSPKHVLRSGSTLTPHILLSLRGRSWCENSDGIALTGERKIQES